MDKKLCEEIASKIVSYENQITTAKSDEERKEAELAIEKICEQFVSLEDMIQIDEEVMKLLS